ncbi:MAG: hypothetical protein PF487_13970 [Bacteroidales bacterium]|jgi:hypothetical protein|nr:hypothetical protein [Bacteroidales bacterium]
MANITFFTGAGASYYACPIWKEQGKKMLQLARIYFKDNDLLFHQLEPKQEYKELDDGSYLIWYIGYFGAKANKYGTIDTYAKKLFLNKNMSNELQKLKLAVSIFFVIWQYIDDDNFKRKDDNEIFIDIDPRYIQLFAAILENNSNGLFLKPSINFVTWNYDLQLEETFKIFDSTVQNLDNVSKNIHFKQSQNELQICHLNGYAGYYTYNNKECTFEMINKLSLDKILDELPNLYKSHKRKEITFDSHINYAWETDNIESEKIRNRAAEIFKETDILVIIGYSFPNFNKEIDKMLFNSLKSDVTIYYQDPKASGDYLEHLVDKTNMKIEYLQKKDFFHLPYEF